MIDAAVSRLRTALESSRGLTLRGRLSLTPSVEVGLRHDAGDAEQGSGVDVDVGGGLVVSDATGLAVDLRVWILLVHGAKGLVRQANWRRIAGESPAEGRNNQPPSPRVMRRSL